MDTLPLEMISEIAKHLSGVDLLNLASTCKDFNKILRKEVSQELESMQFDKYVKHNLQQLKIYREVGLTHSYYLKCIFCGKEQRHKYPFGRYYACKSCISEYNLPSRFGEHLLPYRHVFYLVCNCIGRKLRLIIMSKNYKYEDICKMVNDKRFKNIIHDSSCDRRGIVGSNYM